MHFLILGENLTLQARAQPEVSWALLQSPLRRVSMRRQRGRSPPETAEGSVGADRPPALPEIAGKVEAAKMKYTE